jgi:hypothetical protein
LTSILDHGSMTCYGRIKGKYTAGGAFDDSATKQVHGALDEARTYVPAAAGVGKFAVAF